MIISEVGVLFPLRESALPLIVFLIMSFNTRPSPPSHSQKSGWWRGKKGAPESRRLLGPWPSLLLPLLSAGCPSSPCTSPFPSAAAAVRHLPWWDKVTIPALPFLPRSPEKDKIEYWNPQVSSRIIIDLMLLLFRWRCSSLGWDISTPLSTPSSTQFSIHTSDRPLEIYCRVESRVLSVWERWEMWSLLLLWYKYSSQI